MKRLLILLVILAFYSIGLTAQNIIVPNNGFENWTISTAFEEPDSFVTSNLQAYLLNILPNVSKTSDCNSGSYAIRLETVQSDGNIVPGGLFLGIPGEGGIQGGHPYTGIPDSISLWAKYDISAGDTAFIAFLFTSNGFPIALAAHNFIGSDTNYTYHKEPVTWFTWGIPDTVAMIVFSSSPDGSSGTGSYLYLDDVLLLGTNQQIPNNGFEFWTEMISEEPDAWITSNMFTITGGGISASKSPDSFEGAYSLMLETQHTGWGDSLGWVTNGAIGNDGPIGGIPVDNLVEKVSFYYKSSPLGNDSAVVGGWLFYYDSMLDSTMILEEVYITLPPENNWTYYEMYFSYIGPLVPDTLNISFSSSHIDQTGGEISLGSILYVDKVEVNSLISVYEETDIHLAKLFIQPNPARDFVNIWISDSDFQPLTISLFDIMGNIVYKNTIRSAGNSFQIDLMNIPSGIYSLRVILSEKMYYGKFVK